MQVRTVMRLTGRQAIMNRFIMEQNMITTVFRVMASDMVVAVIKRCKKNNTEDEYKTKSQS
ncbi:MAG: hypothetical protein HY957_10730 [Nitrospirae bacterium]|nr:hypothetical protein [Nitrospirota bacterium]